RYIETLPRLGYRFVWPVLDISKQNAPETDHSAAAVSQEPVVEPRPAELLQAPAEQIKSDPVRSKQRYGLVAIGTLAALIGFGIYLYFGTKGRSPQPVFHPLTYRAQVIRSARFLPDAKSAIYSTFSEPEGARTLKLGIEGTTTPPAVVGDGTLVSVSPSGGVTVLTKPANQKTAQLAQVSPAGQKSPLNADNARAADWLPDGRELALVRVVGAESRVEFPSGHVAYRCTGWISDLRVSPSGNEAAFIEHSTRDDDRGHVRLVDRSGNTGQLTADWNSAAGLAWSRSGREIWFTASKTGVVRNLYAVSTSGQLRRMTNSPASLRLFDIAADGRALVSVDDPRGAMLAEFPGARKEMDVTQFDDPTVQAISSDGERLLFTESGDAGGQHYTTLLFDNARQSSRVIASGRAMAMSPDDRFALILDPDDDAALTLVPFERGSTTRISGHGLHYQWVRFISNRVILAGGSYPGGSLMIYRQPLDGGAPTALTGLPYVDDPVIAPDGEKMIGLSGRNLVLISFCDKSAQIIPFDGVAAPVAWSADHRSVFLAALSAAPPALLKLDLNTKSVTTWKPLQIPQSSSAELGGIAVAPEVGAYAYSTRQDLSRLYVVDGWS